MNSNEPSVGVAVITHRSRQHLPNCLPPILGSPLRPRVLVVNSSSDDGTVELAERMGAQSLIVPREQFNHGTTRELARKRLGTEIVVMLTPDAYPVDEHVLGKLVAPIVAGQTAVAYARQIAHDGAGFFERSLRDFNYPAHSQIRSAEDVASHGIYTIFCSNACAAWLNSALDEIGGFRPVLTNEDTFAVAMLLRQGRRIAYVADAVVKHSHRYSLWQEFRRHFDAGYVRRLHRDWIAFAGGDKARGRAYAKKLLLDAARTRPWLLPHPVGHLLAKWLGYEIGARALKAPVWLKRGLSSQDYYWLSQGREAPDAVAEAPAAAGELRPAARVHQEK